MKTVGCLILLVSLITLAPPPSFPQSADFKMVTDDLLVEYSNDSSVQVFTLPDDFDPNGEAYVIFRLFGKQGDTTATTIYINPQFPEPTNPQCYFGNINPNSTQAFYTYIAGFYEGTQERHWVYNRSLFKPGVNRIMLCLLNPARGDLMLIDNMVIHFHKGK